MSHSLILDLEIKGKLLLRLYIFQLVLLYVESHYHLLFGGFNLMPVLSFLKELDCFHTVLSFCSSNPSIGPTRRCFALDSTSSGRCSWTSVGIHTFGWRHLVSNVSVAYSKPSEYSITVKSYMRCSLCSLLLAL